MNNLEDESDFKHLELVISIPWFAVVQWGPQEERNYQKKISLQPFFSFRINGTIIFWIKQLLVTQKTFNHSLPHGHLFMSFIYLGLMVQSLNCRILIVCFFFFFGRSYAYESPSTYQQSYVKATPKEKASEVKSQRLVPLWVQVLVFLMLAVFLYMVFSSMETNESFRLEWCFHQSCLVCGSGHTAFLNAF